MGKGIRCTVPMVEHPNYRPQGRLSITRGSPYYADLNLPRHCLRNDALLPFRWKLDFENRTLSKYRERLLPPGTIPGVSSGWSYGAKVSDWRDAMRPIYPHFVDYQGLPRKTIVLEMVVDLIRPPHPALHWLRLSIEKYRSDVLAVVLSVSTSSPISRGILKISEAHDDDICVSSKGSGKSSKSLQSDRNLYHAEK